MAPPPPARRVTFAKTKAGSPLHVALGVGVSVEEIDVVYEGVAVGDCEDVTSWLRVPDPETDRVPLGVSDADPVVV